MCLDMRWQVTDKDGTPVDAHIDITLHNPDAEQAILLAHELLSDYGLKPVALLQCTTHRHASQPHGVH